MVYQIHTKCIFYPLCFATGTTCFWLSIEENTAAICRRTSYNETTARIRATSIYVNSKLLSHFATDRIRLLLKWQQLTTLWKRTWNKTFFFTFHCCITALFQTHCTALRGRHNVRLRWRKRGEISSFTWMLCSHCCQLEPQTINTRVYCRVNWPAFTWEWKLFPLRTKADC